MKRSASRREHTPDSAINLLRRTGGRSFWFWLMVGGLRNVKGASVLKKARRCKCLQHVSGNKKVRPKPDFHFGLHALRRSAFAYAREARLRSFSVRSFLRTRIDSGVTSTNSSLSINSSARSSDILIGGLNTCASSVPDARTLVSCLPFKQFTVRSFERL